MAAGTLSSGLSQPFNFIFGTGSSTGLSFTFFFRLDEDVLAWLVQWQGSGVCFGPLSGVIRKELVLCCGLSEGVRVSRQDACNWMCKGHLEMLH